MPAKYLGDVKYCTKCKKTYPLTRFQKYNGYYMSWCKTCKTEREKAQWAKKEESKIF